MNRDEAKAAVWNVAYVGMVNQKFYQAMSWRMWWLDRANRVAVAIMACLSLLLGSGGSEFELVAFCVSVVSATSAVVLNVLPVGDWYTHNHDFFRRWTMLRERAEKLELRLKKSDAETVDASMVTSIEELLDERAGISAEESSPSSGLLAWAERRVDRFLGIQRDATGAPIPTGEGAQAAAT